MNIEALQGSKGALFNEIQRCLNSIRFYFYEYRKIANGTKGSGIVTSIQRYDLEEVLREAGKQFSKVYFNRDKHNELAKYSKSVKNLLLKNFPSANPIGANRDEYLAKDWILESSAKRAENIEEFFRESLFTKTKNKFSKKIPYDAQEIINPHRLFVFLQETEEEEVEKIIERLHEETVRFEKLIEFYKFRPIIDKKRKEAALKFALSHPELLTLR